MSNEQTEIVLFETKSRRFTAIVQSDGGVNFRYASAAWHQMGFEYDSMLLSAEEFGRLVEAQERAVWAGQHWTSLAAVNDALSSLLTVYPSVQVLSVQQGQDRSYFVRLSHPFGGGTFETVADVQALMRKLAEPSV